MYSIQPGAHSVPAGCFLPAGDRTVSLTAGLVPGTAQVNRRGLVCAPHASDEAVPVPSTSEERRTSIHSLRQCICALCEAAAWIADLSPPRVACIASLRTKGTPLAPLCGYPHDAAVSLSPCWSCEAWSRTDRCVRLDAKLPVRGLGRCVPAAHTAPRPSRQARPPTSCIGISKTIFRCPACYNGDIPQEGEKLAALYSGSHPSYNGREPD